MICARYSSVPLRFSVSLLRRQIGECVGDCMTNRNIRRYNYFERDLSEHAMIGHLDYMSMTVRNQRWTRSEYFHIVVSLIE